MELIVVGLSHKTAPIHIRERFALVPEEVAEPLRELLRQPGISEVVLLSTCNRVEIYAVGQQVERDVGTLVAWLASLQRMAADALSPYLYIHTHTQAIRHGFRVAASLDSMVVGEAQILGQMKQAFQQAVAVGSVGRVLQRYFQYVFHVAKRIRNETAIAEQAVSIASTAVSLARRIFGQLTDSVCLLIGAGEMCELAARHLVTNGVKRVLVTNRTLSRAEDLAALFAGEAFPLEELASQLDRADIILSSTGAPHHLVTPAMVKAALKKRKQRPLFFIDIAVPRDIDPHIADMDNVFLYDIDDLQQMVNHHLSERYQAATQAEIIVDEEVPEFLNWLSNLGVAPTIAALRQQFHELRDQEFDRLLREWADLTPLQRQRLDAWSRLLMNKLLHTPMTQLRQMANGEEGDLYVTAVRKVFKLYVTPDPADGTD
ncbi:MAG: glutamyl-tRNA reductase [Magnetococcales bacterium]|nr:glutamyl-tRNA reductase [Magnetococcales bacterium]